MHNDFIKEIKEDVRNDQLLAIWRDYHKVIIGVIVGIFVATGIYLVMHHRHQKSILEQTKLYEQFIDLKSETQPKPDYTALIADGTDGYKILGAFEQARAALENQSQADDLLKGISDNKSLDVFYRQLAELQIIMKNFDGTNGQVLLENLEPLVSKESAIQAAALELKAFAQLKLNDRKGAIQTFTTVLQHPQAPKSLQARARAMLDTLKSSR